MPEIKIFTIYVDQTNGNDSNRGTQKSPFKSLQKAINTVPRYGYGDIHIVGDYTLSSNVKIESKKKITLILHGTLTTTEYSRDNYTGIYSIDIVDSLVHVIIDTNNNGKIVVPAKSSVNNVDPTHYTMFRGTKQSNFIDIKFDLRSRHDNYNPIVINSGFGLVSAGEWSSDKPNLNVKLVGYYIGKPNNRNIIVDSNSTLVSFENTKGKFYYGYDAGLTDETNTAISVSNCIKGDYKVF